MSEKPAPKDRSGWVKEIEFAQTRIFYSLTSLTPAAPVAVLHRIKHQGDRLCPDCGVSPDQLHVPGCEHELCPRCELAPDRCQCTYEETWYLMPEPDKDIPWNGRTVNPLATYANGLVQLDRFHIVEFNGSYIILIKNDNEYVLSPLIFPAAHAALCKLPSLPE